MILMQLSLVALRDAAFQLKSFILRPNLHAPSFNGHQYNAPVKKYEYRNKLQRMKFLHGFKLEIDIFPHQSIDDEVCLFPI